MATAKSTRSTEGLECPVCMELMSGPIYNCMSGHSLCNACTVRLPTPKCPICREDMTQIRNRHLEDLVAKVETGCPNKAAGCEYKMKPAAVADHLRECILREMACPHGAVFGKCSWEGKLKDMAAHFSERHAEASGAAPEEELALAGVSAATDDRRLYLVTVGKAHFILTFKIDTLQKMAYWCVQNIGPKVSARQWLYEIHVAGGPDARRKVTYIDHCFNDAVKAEDVFKSGKCAMLPLPALATFVKESRLVFRFFLKRGGPVAKEHNKPDARNGGGGGSGGGGGGGGAGGGGKPGFNKKDKGDKGKPQPGPGKKLNKKAA